MRSLALHVGCVLGLFGVLAAAPASASETYPPDLKKQLMLAEEPGTPPGCQLCHKDDEGGVGNVDKPFGRSLMREGAVGASIPSLRAALKALDETAWDSDGDGVGDIDELRAVTDPNVGADGTVNDPYADIPLPETGCSLARGNRGSLASGLGLAAAWALLLLRRRR